MPWDGPVDPSAGRSRPWRADPPLGQGRAMRRGALHPAPGRGRRGRLRRLHRQTPTTTRWPRPSTPSSRPSSSATGLRGRASTTSRSPSRLHRLVQPPTPARRDRPDPTGRARGRPSTGTTPRRLPSPRQFRAFTEPGAGQAHPLGARPVRREDVRGSSAATATPACRARRTSLAAPAAGRWRVEDLGHIAKSHLTRQASPAEISGRPPGASDHRGRSCRPVPRREDAVARCRQGPEVRARP
jgi:hypothetical protein